MENPAPEPIKEKVADNAADIAADLVREDQYSTWDAIIRRHPSAIPPWNGDRELVPATKKR